MRIFDESRVKFNPNTERTAIQSKDVKISKIGKFFGCSTGAGSVRLGGKVTDCFGKNMKIGGEGSLLTEEKSVNRRSLIKYLKIEGSAIKEYKLFGLIPYWPSIIIMEDADIKKNFNEKMKESLSEDVGKIAKRTIGGKAEVSESALNKLVKMQPTMEQLGTYNELFVNAVKEESQTESGAMPNVKALFNLAEVAYGFTSSFNEDADKPSDNLQRMAKETFFNNRPAELREFGKTAANIKNSKELFIKLLEAKKLEVEGKSEKGISTPLKDSFNEQLHAVINHFNDVDVAIQDKLRPFLIS